MAESKRDQVLTPEQKAKLKEKVDIKNFDLNAILRGAQLTVVGALRALQNPALFTSEHYKQAAYAVAAGIAIKILVSIPTTGIRILLWFLSIFIKNFRSTSWNSNILNTLDFINVYVLQVPFFLMTMMRHITPTLDNMFMDSLRWVDYTYAQKHKTDDPSQLRPMYWENLRKYRVSDGSTHSRSTAEAVTSLMIRRAKKAGLSLAIYALSFVPYVGRFVLPAASFYTFNSSVGLGPSLAIFGTGIFLPRRYLVIFLQSYFTSRALMRELLEPYFSRIKFSKSQKKKWFHDRSGLLFGFALGFYIFLRIPLLGVLIYGIAEASTAYLVTKITDPPPEPTKFKSRAELEQWTKGQVRWRNKHEFLSLDMWSLDASDGHKGHIQGEQAQNPITTGVGDSAQDEQSRLVGDALEGNAPRGPPPPYEESELRRR